MEYQKTSQAGCIMKKAFQKLPADFSENATFNF